MINTMSVIPENTGSIGSFGESNDVMMSFSMSRKPENLLRMEMDVCVPEVVAVGHHCTYEGHYWRMKVQKSGLALTAILSLIVCRFLGVCGVIQIWVKDFQACRPCDSTARRWILFGARTESFHGGLKQCDHYSPCLC